MDISAPFFRLSLKEEFEAREEEEEKRSKRRRGEERVEAEEEERRSNESCLWAKNGIYSADMIE